MSEGVPWTFAVGEEVALRSWGRVVVENVNGAQALVRYSSQSGSTVWVSTSKLGPLPKPARPGPTARVWPGSSLLTSLFPLGSSIRVEHRVTLLVRQLLRPGDNLRESRRTSCAVDG
jgi:hypothetical protein